MINLSDLSGIYANWRQGNKAFACFLVLAALFSFAVGLAIYFPAMCSISYYTGMKLEYLAAISILIPLCYKGKHHHYRLVTIEGQAVMFITSLLFAWYWELEDRPGMFNYIIPSEFTYIAIYMVLIAIVFYIVIRASGIFEARNTLY